MMFRELEKEKFMNIEKEKFMNMLILDSMTLEGFSHYD